MKIIIESQSIIKNKTGVGYYTYNLINGLQKEDKINKYSLMFLKLRGLKDFRPIELTNNNFVYRVVKFPLSVYRKLFKYLVAFPINIFVGKPDLVLFTNFVSFPVIFSKKVIVIYDLSYIKFSQYSDPKNASYLTKFVPISIKSADRIITISRNSKKEIMEEYNVPEHLIDIVYPSYNHRLFTRSNDKQISLMKKKYNIVGDYILFTGTLEPRKNVQSLIKSYCQLPKNIKSKYSLVLAGGKGWQDDDILKEMERAKMHNERIIITGYIPEEDLPILYSGATVFVYPSFYEGFGIPILEAMACGCPVITSNTSSMPEVAGEAALLINPNSVEEIKNSIEKVLSDKDIRGDMINKGYEQIKIFNWSSSAKELIRIFEKTIDKK